MTRKNSQIDRRGGGGSPKATVGSGDIASHGRDQGPRGNTAAPVSSGAARNERRQIRQILRRALAGPITPPSDFVRGSPGDGERLPDRTGTMAPKLVARLVADGLLALAPDGLVATAETAAWLRRDLCDLPDEAHASQHRDIEVETLVTADGRQAVRRNLQESPLFPLLRLKEKDGRAFLNAEAVSAGERLAADFDFAGLQPRMTARWQPRLSTRVRGAPPPAVELADNRLAARTRVARAVEAMGPELSGVALDVCCFGKGLETVERERQWPARSAKLMLRAALLSLARHYAPPPARSRPRHWGEEGFRPKIG